VAGNLVLLLNIAAPDRNTMASLLREIQNNVTVGLVGFHPLEGQDYTGSWTLTRTDIGLESFRPTEPWSGDDY